MNSQKNTSTNITYLSADVKIDNFCFNRLRDKKYRLCSIYSKSLRLKSVEITKDHDILVALANTHGTIQWRRVVAKQPTKNSKFEYISKLWGLSKNFSARLHKQLVYAVHDNTISVIDYPLQSLDFSSDLIDTKHGYFLFKSNSLVGCGKSNLNLSKTRFCTKTNLDYNRKLGQPSFIIMLPLIFKFRRSI